MNQKNWIKYKHVAGNKQLSDFEETNAMMKKNELTKREKQKLNKRLNNDT